MDLILTSAGSYPRIGETPEAQRHRRAYAQRERGEISDVEWHAVEDEVAGQVVREQTAAGLDVATDGQVRWYDPISHIARHCDGIQINGLLRYFDTNFYFRQPVVSGPIRRREPVLRREFEVARAATDRVVKPVLTGPYSLAQGSILEGGYRSRRELARAYAEVLAQEVADLVHAGAALIQVDEPYLLRHPGGRRPRARGPCHPGGRAGAGASGALHLLRGRPPALGCHHGDAGGPRRARPHVRPRARRSHRRRRRAADPGARRWSTDGTRSSRRGTACSAPRPRAPGLRGPVALGPSCGLELLPRDRARAKLENMAALAREYTGHEGRTR